MGKEIRLDEKIQKCDYYGHDRNFSVNLCRKKNMSFKSINISQVSMWTAYFVIVESCRNCWAKVQRRFYVFVLLRLIGFRPMRL